MELPRNVSLTDEAGNMSRIWFETLVSIFKTKADVTLIKASEVPSGAVKVKFYFDGQNIYMENL
jgi:hypothetical protein